MGEILDDKTLYIDLGNMVYKDSMLDDAHINFNVYNQAVLMTGEAPNENIREYLESIVKSKSPKIKQVNILNRWKYKGSYSMVYLYIVHQIIMKKINGIIT